MFVDYTVTLEVESYIAHPYWEETERVVNIMKKSGLTRAKSDQAREKALRDYLSSIGMTAEEYERLSAKAALEWHFDDQGRIIIPRHQMSGCLVQTLVSMSSSHRPFKDGGVLRSLCQISDFVTPRTKADDTWVRFVRPTKDGKPLSNQRSERRNQVIRKFTATGTLSFDPAEIATDAQEAEDKVRRMLEYGGHYVGLGASRKMGHGRFKVLTFTPAAAAQDAAA